MTLDLSKRSSRSGKFRLVTKFKKEKNNKNREARSSLGAPGTYLLPPGPEAPPPLPAPPPRVPHRLELQDCTLASLLCAGC